VTRNRSLLPYVRGWKAIKNKMFDELFSSKLGYILRYLPSKRARFIKESYAQARGYNFDGISVFTPRLLRKIHFKRLIASPWETTYFVNYCNAECSKYTILQYRDNPAALKDYLQGVDADLVSQTFSFPLKKIFINAQHLTEYSIDKPQKMQLGINTSEFYQKILLDKRNGKTILVPLRTHAEKGASCAIEAIKLIYRQRKDIKIITFGNYDHTELIPEYVEHRGFVDDKKLIDLYNSASIFVIPSLLELFCLPGLEAMACGCAVISSDNVGIREYMKDNINGIIVPANNPNAIAKSVISLVDDPNQRMYLARNGLETARTFSEENMMKSFITAIMNFEQGKLDPL
jgi:glycosyltransferase involved in cell wall biosynthesis